MHAIPPTILALLAPAFIGPRGVQAVTLMAAAALATLGLAWLWQRRRWRLLAELRRVAERFAAGDLTRQEPLDGPADLALLGQALTRMAGQLDERLQALTTQRNQTMAVLSSMAEGVLAVDLQERVLTANPAAMEMLDLDPVNTIGRPLVELIRHAGLGQIVQRALQSDALVQGEVQLRPAGADPAPAAPPRLLLVQGTMLRDAWGRRMGGLLVLEDVTRMRQLEAVRREFVANVSHEIKTPVAAIRAAAETLQDLDPRDADRAQQFLGVIVRQADRLNLLVEDLLDLARLEQDAEREAVPLRSQCLADVLAAALDEHQAKAQRKHLVIDVTCPPDLAAPVNAGLLERAVANLLDNAIKYSPEGGRVDLSARRDEGQVVVEVRDQGCGIAPEHLPRLFERFYRVDRARSRALGGTGLGLAIVKHVAQAHGGTVSVQSAPGKGSTFRIHLPLGARAQDTGSDAAAPPGGAI